MHSLAYYYSIITSDVNIDIIRIVCLYLSHSEKSSGCPKVVIFSGLSHRLLPRPHLQLIIQLQVHLCILPAFVKITQKHAS